MDMQQIMTADGRLAPSKMRGDPIASVSHLYFSYGSRLVLKDICFELYPGEIFGFLGPNGSGKTTTIKLMLGLNPAASGRITIGGKDIKRDRAAALKSVGGVIENPEMYTYLTGRQNLEIYRRMLDSVEGSRIDEVAHIVGLSERLGDKVSKYSLGMRQRLGLAQALLSEPKLLVLDEPTNGLDPKGIAELRDLLKWLAVEKAVSVFISSHQLAELEQVCDRVAILNSGSIVRTLTMDEIRDPSGDGSTEVVIELEPESVSLIPEDCALKLAEGRLVGTVAEAELPSIIASLALAGVRIKGVERKTRRLEEVYLELTGQPSVAREDDRSNAVNEYKLPNGDAAVGKDAEGGEGA